MLPRLALSPHISAAYLLSSPPPSLLWSSLYNFHAPLTSSSHLSVPYPPSNPVVLRGVRILKQRDDSRTSQHGWICNVRICPLPTLSFSGLLNFQTCWASGQRLTVENNWEIMIILNLNESWILTAGLKSHRYKTAKWNMTRPIGILWGESGCC